MTSIIGRLTRSRRKTPLPRSRLVRTPTTSTERQNGTTDDNGVMIVREYRRDPRQTEWTFKPMRGGSKKIDVLELLERDDPNDELAVERSSQP